MDKETLNSQRKKLLNYLIEQFGKKSIIPKDIYNYVIEQDKDFIKKLKEEIKDFISFDNKLNRFIFYPQELEELLKRIDTLAGEELV